MSGHTITRALRALRDAALEELPLARADGNADLVTSLARIFDTAADVIEAEDKAIAARVFDRARQPNPCLSGTPE